MRRLQAGAFLFSKIPQAFAPICNIFKLPPGTDLLQPIFWPLFALLLKRNFKNSTFQISYTGGNLVTKIGKPPHACAFHCKNYLNIKLPCSCGIFAFVTVVLKPREPRVLLTLQRLLVV
jgi:hypothetical protein